MCCLVWESILGRKVQENPLIWRDQLLRIQTTQLKREPFYLTDIHLDLNTIIFSFQRILRRWSRTLHWNRWWKRSAWSKKSWKKGGKRQKFEYSSKTQISEFLIGEFLWCSVYLETEKNKYINNPLLLEGDDGSKLREFVSLISQRLYGFWSV